MDLEDAPRRGPLGAAETMGASAGACTTAAFTSIRITSPAPEAVSTRFPSWAFRYSTGSARAPTVTDTSSCEAMSWLQNPRMQAPDQRFNQFCQRRVHAPHGHGQITQAFVARLRPADVYAHRGSQKRCL